MIKRQVTRALKSRFVNEGRTESTATDLITDPPRVTRICSSMVIRWLIFSASTRRSPQAIDYCLVYYYISISATNYLCHILSASTDNVP